MFLANDSLLTNAESAAPPAEPASKGTFDAGFLDDGAPPLDLYPNRKLWWDCEPVLQSKEQERKPPHLQQGAPDFYPNHGRGP